LKPRRWPPWVTMLRAAPGCPVPSVIYGIPPCASTPGGSTPARMIRAMLAGRWLPGRSSATCGKTAKKKPLTIRRRWLPCFRVGRWWASLWRRCCCKPSSRPIRPPTAMNGTIPKRRAGCAGWSW